MGIFHTKTIDMKDFINKKNMLQWLFSVNTKYRYILYLIFALSSVIIGLFLTFSLFFDISRLSLIPSFQDGVLTFFVPIMIYSNVDSEKLKILSGNKEKPSSMDGLIRNQVKDT